jgi:hypothetical protein
MFHEIIKFGFETFADMEHRGWHISPRTTPDGTRSVDAKHSRFWLEAPIKGYADLDVSLASRYKIDWYSKQAHQ